MKSRILVFALMLCCWGSRADLAATPLAASAKPPTPEQDARVAVARPMIELHDNLLSVSIRNAPWEAVLQELARHTGIMIRLQGTLSGTLTQEFTALPVEQGLRRLFREVNFVASYTSETKEGIAAPPLIRVWLFPQADSAAPHGTLPPQASSLGERPRAAGNHPEGGLLTDEDLGENRRGLYAHAAQGNMGEVRQAIFERDPVTQAEAFALLAQWDYQEAVTALVEAMESEQPELQQQALHLLHQSDQVDDATVLAALRPALVNENLHVRGTALQALAERGGPDAMVYLRDALRDPDPVMRRMVIKDIVPLVQKILRLSLIQEALADGDEMVRSLAAARLEKALAKGR